MSNRERCKSSLPLRTHYFRSSTCMRIFFNQERKRERATERKRKRYTGPFGGSHHQHHGGLTNLRSGTHMSRQQQQHKGERDTQVPSAEHINGQSQHGLTNFRSGISMGKKERHTESFRTTHHQPLQWLANLRSGTRISKKKIF